MRSRQPGKLSLTIRSARRAALFATDDLGFRVALATLLAVGAMFGVWAVDLTLKDAHMIPAGNVPAASQTLVPAVLATPVQEVAASRVYVVRRGDTLRGLAARAYGDESLWRLIYDANRDRVANPASLLIGTRLRIPDRSAATDAP